MNTSLHIHLDQSSFALKDASGYINIRGSIQLDHAATLPTWARIQFLGRERIGDTTQIIADDTYQLSSRQNDWHQDPDNKNRFILPFSFSISQDIPSSIHICKCHEEDKGETGGGIYYTVEATVSTIEKKSVEPIVFYRPFNNLSIPRRLCWGITRNSDMWQYELDVPHILDTSTETGTINVRLRSSQRNSKKIAETCLIGCQLIQLIHLDSHDIQYQVLMTATQLLTSPNSTWSKPCQIDFDVFSPPLPSVSSEHLSVDHYLKLTLSFCDLTGKANHSIDSEFPITVTGCCSDPQAVVDMIPRSESVCSTEIASHDSAVDLQLPESFKAIFSH